MKCKFCGAELEGRYCSQCGMLAQDTEQDAPSNGQTSAAGQPKAEQQKTAQQGPSAPPQQRKRKPIWKRWWFYPLAIIATIWALQFTKTILDALFDGFGYSRSIFGTAIVQAEPDIAPTQELLQFEVPQVQEITAEKMG